MKEETQREFTDETNTPLEGADAEAEALRELRMAQQAGEDELEGLIERAKEQPDCVFDRKVLEALVLQRENEPIAFASLRRALKASGVPLGELEAALKRTEKEMQERVEREQQERTREAALRLRIVREEQLAKEAQEHETLRQQEIERAPWKGRHYATTACEGSTYTMEPGKLTVYLPSSKKDEEKCIEAGFSARILRSRVEYNGTEPARSFVIEAATTPQGPPRVLEVSAESWQRDRWIEQHLGSVFVSPERGARERIRAGISLLSMPVPEERIHACIGFADVDGERVYLHASGSIGASSGSMDAKASVPSDLSGYSLPAPLEGEALQKGIRAALELIDLHPVATVALFGAVWRAPLGATRTSLYLGGKPASGKSTLAGLAQAHFGAMWDGERFPADWNTSTANGLMLAMTQIGDALFVVDDLKLSGTSKDDAVYAKADAIVRFQFNGSTPRRMTRDLRARTGSSSRCLLVATGEVLPRGESLRSRMIVLELHERIKADLAPYVRNASKGLYAATMAAFLRWLASRSFDVRALETAAEHLLLPGADRPVKMLASLLVGLDRLLEFATETRAIDRKDAEARRTRYVRELCSTRDAQSGVVAQEDPALRFRELVLSALHSGKAHVLNTMRSNPIPPDDPVAFGWKQDAEKRWIPSGERIGWMDPTQPGVLWLLKEASYAVVCEIARRTGHPFALALADLPKRLHMAGMLSKHCEAYRKQKGTSTARKKINGIEHACVDLVIAETTSAVSNTASYSAAEFLEQARSTGARFVVEDRQLRIDGIDNSSLAEEIRVTAESFGSELLELLPTTDN